MSSLHNPTKMLQEIQQCCKKKLTKNGKMRSL